MTSEQKRIQEMLDYLQVLKYSHEAHALTEIERHGSEQYAQYEMDRAKLVGSIIDIIEYFMKMRKANMLIHELNSLDGMSPTVDDSWDKFAKALGVTFVDLEKK